MTTAPTLLLLLAVGALAAVPAAAADAEPPGEPTAPDVVDEARATARSTAEWLARSVDSWFGDRPFDQGGKVSDGRISLGLLHRRDEGTDVSLRFNARFRLPNVERTAYLFIGRDNRRELVSDTPAAFTRQDRLLAEQRADQTFFAGLGYDLRDDFDFRLGLRGGLKPYVQLRYRKPWVLGPRDLIDFRETVFWSASDRVGSTTALSYEHAYSPSLALRWLNAATITQRRKEFEWSTDLGLVKAIEGDRRAAVEVVAEGTTGTGVPVREWGLQTRWLQPLTRNRLQGELIVGRFWARPDEATPRMGVWALGLKLTMQF